MRIFLTGATGAIGTALLPRLVQDGHDVVAAVRSRDKANLVERMGATPSLVDPSDSAALRDAVIESRPEVVLHQLTALRAARGNFRKFDDEFALTNQFRTVVTDTLLDAARAANVEHFIAQSFCGWPYARVGGPIKTEDDPLDDKPPRSMQETLAAIRYQEDLLQSVTDIRTCALRYGLFYGPGTGIEKNGPLIKMIRRRQFPLVGGGTGIWSFIHIDDAAEATRQAISLRAHGLFNIVDDEPAPVAEWLPHLASVVGAKKPWRVPAWLARPLIGDAGIMMMLHARGCSNAKAKQRLSWRPRYPSWRQGFAEGLG